MINLARSSLALVLSALFGAAKSCALVNLFMICPRLSVVTNRQQPDSASDHGHLMASVLGNRWLLSALPPKANIHQRNCDVRFVPAGKMPAASDRISDRNR
jgi:hypothetical protein